MAGKINLTSKNFIFPFPLIFSCFFSFLTAKTWSFAGIISNKIDTRPNAILNENKKTIKATKPISKNASNYGKNNCNYSIFIGFMMNFIHLFQKIPKTFCHCLLLYINNNYLIIVYIFKNVLAILKILK